MEKIYSRVNAGQVLHVIHRKHEATMPRQDFAAPEESLQVAAIRLPRGKKVRPHRHLAHPRTARAVQEAWIVAQGKIKGTYYDVDKTVLSEQVLETGDCSVTFAGAHTYEPLEEDTLVYEAKTGPYLGQEKDLEYIGE